MYRLAFTPTCLDISFDKILVAGKTQKSEKCYEMSLFRIPAKLMTTCPEDEGMTKERDFSLVAGVTHQKYNFIQVRSEWLNILSLTLHSISLLWALFDWIAFGPSQTDNIIRMIPLSGFNKRWFMHNVVKQERRLKHS